MKHESARILTSYVEAFEEKLAKLPERLPPDIADLLQIDPDLELETLFGPDIEHHLLENEDLISGNKSPAHIRARAIVERVKKRFANILYHNTKGEDFDCQKIETRLAPATPSDVLNRYHDIRNCFMHHANERGLTMRFGLTEHWHVSVNQFGDSLFNSSNPAFTFCAVAGILRIQQLAPALFLDPRRVEDEEIKDSFEVTQIRFLKDESLEVSDFGTIEPKMGVGPEASVLLYLSGLIYGLDKYASLLNHSRKAKTRSGNVRVLAHLTKIFSKKDDFPDFGDGTPVHPKGGFLTHLEKTSELDLAEFLPWECSRLLLEDAIQRYYDFLTSPVGQTLYVGEEREHIMLKLRDRAEKAIGPQPAHTLHACYN